MLYYKNNIKGIKNKEKWEMKNENEREIKKEEKGKRSCMNEQSWYIWIGGVTKQK